MKKYLEIGETDVSSGKKFKCVEGTNCIACCFASLCASFMFPKIDCQAGNRKDGKNVYFIRV